MTLSIPAEIVLKSILLIENMKRIKLFLLIFIIFILWRCSPKPSQQFLEEFEKQELQIKTQDLKLYLSESSEEENLPLPEIDKEYEMTVIGKSGKSYYGLVNNFRVLIKDDAELGDKLLIKITDFTKSGKSAKADLVKKIENVSAKTDRTNIEFNAEYDIEIIGSNNKGEAFGIINQNKVIVIGAVSSIKKYRVKIIDYDESSKYYYSLPVIK
ncbi:MAG TPA: hypothetical protein PKY81_05905 [bacterium]|nr:hypothetical protein [bacterium]HPN30473.1 hypothetical protein [bacterium]